MKNNAEQNIIAKGVKPTANRILVYQALRSSSGPQTLADLEVVLPSLDKSSISRVLNLFVDNDIIHCFEDGRGVQNYELCQEEGLCNHHDNHLHFFCTKCQRSFCLQPFDIHSINLPKGYVASGMSFVLKGLCDKCNHSA